MDNWKHRSERMRCGTCMFFVPKAAPPEPGHIATAPREGKIGRCRRHAPTLNGWPVVFATDWCGAHKLDETKVI